jgi:hypothetical protein
MIIKQESKCKESGEVKTSYTTDKPGYKVVIRGGEPVEEKMSEKERTNRDHGANTDGHGAVGSSVKQKGQTRKNVEGAKKYREKMEEGSVNPIKKAAKKVEVLKNKLKKAKLDHLEASLVKRAEEIVKKEKDLKQVEKFLMQDRKKLKDKHSYYVDDESIDKKSEEMKKDIVDKIEDIVGSDSQKKETVEEGKKDITTKLNKIADLDKMMYGDKKRSYNKGDVKDIISKLGSKIEEAEDDEEEPEEEPTAPPSDEETTDAPESGEESPEGAPDQEPETDETEELGGEEEPDETEGGEDLEAEEPEEDALPNEVKYVVDREEFNVDSNNSYDFYDFIIDKLFSANAIKALNVEYNRLPEDKRKIIPANELFNKVTKRLDLMDKAEKERLETELEVGSGEDEL